MAVSASGTRGLHCLLLPALSVLARFLTETLMAITIGLSQPSTDLFGAGGVFVTRLLVAVPGRESCFQVCGDLALGWSGVPLAGGDRFLG